MPFWQLFYHIVWATKHRAPILTPDIEPLIYDLLQAKAISLGGHVYALNGAYDHVHLITAIPPKIALAKFIGQIKAVASTKYNQAHPYAPPFFWQKEYSIFSFAKNQLPFHVHYVERQKERHADKNIIPVLETVPTSWQPDLSGVIS
jgi:putative transposase